MVWWSLSDLSYFREYPNKSLIVESTSELSSLWGCLVLCFFLYLLLFFQSPVKIPPSLPLLFFFNLTNSSNIFQERFMIRKYPDFSDYRNLLIFLSGFHSWLCPHSTREEKEYFLTSFRKYFIEFIFPLTDWDLENRTLVSL